MGRSRFSEEESGHKSHVKYSPHCGEEGGRIPVETAIEIGRHWQWHHEEPEEEVCRCSSFFPSIYQFLRGRCRELIKEERGHQPMNGTIWGNGVPSLSNSFYAASPPLVVVGWITFYQTRSVQGSNLSVSRRPYSCY
jgi:hypothetical protein